MGDKPRRKWPWIIGGAVPLLIVGGVAGCGRSSPISTAPVVAPRAHLPAAPAISGPTVRQPAPLTGLTSFGDGTYRIGTAAGDVPAGTYRTTGSTEGMPCYWERTETATGASDAIIASGYAPGPASVTIKSTDGAFVTSGCARWIRDGAA